VEYLTQGDLQIVVRNGVLDLDAMARTKLSAPQLFASLRAAQIQQLGEVKRAYMEANGEFSIFRQEPPKPGLSVLPRKDKAIWQAEPTNATLKACLRCGHTEPTNAQPAQCPRCGYDQWAATVDKL